MQRKIALITGGAKGIGAAIVKKLATDGYDIAINYQHSQSNAYQLIDELASQGKKAIAIQADISQEAGILNLFQEIDTQLGPITVLVNNAGINSGVGPVTDLSWDTLQKIFATNVFASFICSREAVKRMQAVGAGAIINISSEAGKFGGNQMAAYAASKAAINTFTIAFAREVAKFNIRVNAVSPSIIDTEMQSHLSAERLAQLLNSLPMQRMGTAAEVAEVVSWLCSEKASYISGAIIPITGAR